MTCSELAFKMEWRLDETFKELREVTSEGQSKKYGTNLRYVLPFVECKKGNHLNLIYRCVGVVNYTLYVND